MKKSMKGLVVVVLTTFLVMGVREKEYYLLGGW